MGFVGKRVMVYVAGVCLLFGNFLSAQSKAIPVPSDEGQSRVILDWETFKNVTNFKDRVPQEGVPNIRIPWSEVEDLLQIKIEKVNQTMLDVPWREFRAILQWSLEQKQKTAPPAPPVDFLIGSTAYTGKITKDGAEFGMEMQIRILQEKGWKRIPVLPVQVAIQSVQLPDKSYLSPAGSFYELITEKSGDLTFKANFAVAVQEQSGTSRVSFARPRSSSCMLELAIDQKNLDVNVEKAQMAIKKEDSNATLMLAALPPEAPVNIFWERAAKEIEKIPPKIYTETRTLAAIGEGMVTCRERINFSILHTGIRELNLSVPQGVSILEVTGTRVRDWRVKDGSLLVMLDFEAIGGYSLEVSYEKMMSGEQVQIPLLNASDAVREKGFIGVVAFSNAEISGKVQTVAASIDVRDLPADILGMTSQPILLAYRYTGTGALITLDVKKHPDVDVLVTIVDAASFVSMQTADGRRITKVTYSVRNNRNQFLRLTMPSGEPDVWSVMVSGRPIRPAKDENGRILIPLVRSDSRMAEMSAFPVELVYVERTPPFAEKGTMNVALPVCSEPITHVMYSVYLPENGRYEGWGGNMTKVAAFTQIGRAPSSAASGVAQGDVDQLSKIVQQQVEKEAVAAGVTPIHVQLPIIGRPFLLEKVLVLGDTLSYEYRYQFKKAR